jgi:hypothetical protein
MGSDRIVEEQIKEAVASGELTPTHGVGEPFGKLDNDPAWWAKALLRREQAADRYGDVKAARSERIGRAVEAKELSEARAILASLNRDLTAWNAKVGDEHKLDLIDEIWLLTERENARQ